MSVQGKRIAKNTLALYFRTFVTMIVTLYSSRLVLEALGVSDFGLFSLVGGLMVLMGFLNAAMSSATQRFLNYEKGRRDGTPDVRRVFATSFFIHILLALLILALAETVGLWVLNSWLTITPGRLEAANLVYQCALMVFIAGVIASPSRAAMISNERMVTFATVSIVDVGLKLLLAMALQFLSGYRLEIYAALMAVIGIVIAAVYILYSRHLFEECRTWPKRDPKLFREILYFSSWSILSNLSVALRLQGSNVVLNLVFGTLVNAAFGLALQVNSALQSFTASFTQALNPQIVKTWAAGETEQMHRLVLRGCRLSFFLVLVLVLPVLLVTEPLLGIWLKTVPDYTTVFVQLVLVQALIDSVASIASVAQGATGRVKAYHLTVSAMGMMNLPISVVALLAGAPPPSIFFIAIIIAVIIGVTRFLFLQRSIRLSLRTLFREVVVRCAIVVVVAPIPPLALRMVLPHSAMNALIVAAFTILSVLITVALLGLYQEERRMLTGWIARRARFLG